MQKILQSQKDHRSLINLPSLSSAELEEKLRIAADENPQNNQIQLALGNICFLNNKLNDAKRCFEIVLKKLPTSIDAILSLAKIIHAQGDTEEAIKRILSVATKRPEIEDCWQLLADYFAKSGDDAQSKKALAQLQMVKIINAKVAEAQECFAHKNYQKTDQLVRLILDKIPNEIGALQLMSKLALKAGHVEDHLFVLEKCKTLRPDDIEIGVAYANALMYNKKAHEALSECQRLIELAPEEIEIYPVKAAALISLSHYAEAAYIYTVLADFHEQRALCFLRLGNVQKIIGRAQSAVESFKSAIAVDPLIGESYWNLANLKIYLFPNDEIKNMGKLIDENKLSEQSKILIQFALGKALEDRQQFKESFSYYKKANDGYSKFRNYQYISQHKALINFFDSEYFSQKKTFGHSSHEPIFIVGLPRSGSTLVEQILSSHSQVDGTIEMTEIVSIARDLDRSGGRGPGQLLNALNNLSSEECARLGERYLAYAKPLRQNAPFFIDKLPANFHHIGLIKTVFPHAKIIDVRRNPMGSGWSLYKHFFAEGSEYSYNLAHIGRYYNDYIELMAHWDEVLPGQILSVTYEELVADLELHTQRILDYCGLEFEPCCLDYHKNTRAVATPSSEQVRKPIYNHAIDQWKNYRPFLAPLEDIIISKFPLV